MLKCKRETSCGTGGYNEVVGCDTAWCGSQGRAAEPEAKQVMGDILDQRFISAGECFNVSIHHHTPV